MTDPNRHVLKRLDRIDRHLQAPLDQIVFISHKVLWLLFCRRIPLETRHWAAVGVGEVDDNGVKGNARHRRQFLPDATRLRPCHTDHIDG